LKNIKDWMYSIIQKALSKIGYALGEGLKRNTPTLRREIERRAVVSTADYVEKNLSNAQMFLSHQELLTYLVSRSMDQGLVMEFGVYKANTINFISKLIDKKTPGRKVWGFDSFEGLPSDWAGYIITKETFDLKGRLPRVHKNVELVKGFFDKSLEEWLKNYTQEIKKISILHIDSDLYESCNTILNKLNNYIIPGTYILFDEYFNFPNWENHEYKSFQEYTSNNNIKYKYIGYFEQKVLVEIVSK